MKEQRVLVTGNEYASEVQDKVDAIMAEGWLVVSVTAQHVASSSSQTVRGKKLRLFEREKQ